MLMATAQILKYIVARTNRTKTQLVTILVKLKIIKFKKKKPYIKITAEWFQIEISTKKKKKPLNRRPIISPPQ